MRTSSVIAVKNDKIIVIREPLVLITGSGKSALILSQLLYTERESDGSCPVLNVDVFDWFSKSAKQLSEETMSGWSCSTIGRHLKTLIKLGFLKSRKNPENTMDSANQYKIELDKIQQSLDRQGLSLPCFPIVKGEKQ